MQHLPIGCWFQATVLNVKHFLDSKSSLRLSEADISVVAIILAIVVLLYVAHAAWSWNRTVVHRIVKVQTMSAVDLTEIKRQIIREADAVRDLVKEAFEEKNMRGNAIRTAVDTVATPSPKVLASSRQSAGRNAAASEESESSTGKISGITRPQRARKATVKFSPSRSRKPAAKS